jgi:hypothetical protein
MEVDFVTFKIAKKLKEKGFNEPCFLHYTNIGGVFSNSIDTYDRPNQELDYSDFQLCFNDGNSIGFIDAPTTAQALKWLRKEKRIDAGAIWSNNDKVWVGYVNEMDMPDLVSDCVLPHNSYDDYEEAALHAIEYVLDNLI